MTEDNSAAIGSDPSLLLVDDDEVFVTRLARAMERRGFQPRIATSVAAAREAGAALGLRVITGVELSAVDGGREVHILGLHLSRINDTLDRLRAEQPEMLGH